MPISTFVAQESNGKPKSDVLLGYRVIRDPQNPQNLLQVELTAEDLLHPQEGDEPVHSSWHAQTTALLLILLKKWCAFISNSLILRNQIVKWRPEFGHAPDIVFFLNANPKFDGATFYLYETNAQPQFTLEVVSHSTPEVAENDTVKKLGHYYQVGVPQYILVDREEVKGVWVAKLTNYVRGQTSYVIGEKNERGHIALQGTPYFLGVVEPAENSLLEPLIGLFDETGKALGLAPVLELQLSQAIEARIKAENDAQEEKNARIKAENGASKAKELYEAKLRELGVSIPLE